MSFGFRVCFVLTAEGSLTSDEEFIPFVARRSGLSLKLSSGSAGASISKSDRFSISGGPFQTAEDAQAVAEQVRVALLYRATANRRGIDLGQQSLKGFAMSDHGRQYIAELLNVQAVREDHLGITVFRDDPKPKFVRINAQGLVSTAAQVMVDDLAAFIGHYRFASEKAEISAGIYAISHFVGRAPARFLLLFVSLEALFEPAARSEEAQKHVQSLIEATQHAPIPVEERDALASSLTFLKSKSIAQTGRDLAVKLLAGQTYEGADAATFFSRVYKMRNSIVHKGNIEPEAIHSILGEMDRFVADLIRHHYVEP
jgi:hypothetical protein